MAHGESNIIDQDAVEVFSIQGTIGGLSFGVVCAKCLVEWIRRKAHIRLPKCMSSTGHRSRWTWARGA